MSTYRFKIRNDYKLITGGTINPMLNTAHTGNQVFEEYLTIKREQTVPTIYPSISRGSTDETTFNERINSFNEFKQRRKIGIIPPNDYNSPVKRSDLVDIISSGNSISTVYNFKNIVIPITTTIGITDYGDDIQNFIEEEEKKAINPIVDYERIKYTSVPYPSIDLKFRFFNKTSGQYDDNNLTGGYNLAEFNNDEINKKNNFKKSFFRLYFFDSNDTRKQNLLLTEEIDVFKSTKPEFKFGRIFWLKEDEVFDDSNDNRTVYMEARFFNAKTGRVHRFINPPSTTSNPLSIVDLKNNQSWKTSQILIMNPKNTNGIYQFKPVDGIGANTQNTITMTEYILET